MPSTFSLPDIRKQVDTLGVAEKFFDSIVLFALFDSGVFTRLASGPKTLDDLVDSEISDTETLRAVLDAAVALKILARDDDGRYTAEDALLDCMGRPDSAAYMGEWIAFLHALAGPLLELGDAARTGSTPGALFEDMSGDSLPARRMTQAMDAYARTRGVEMAQRLDLSGVTTLLDLGCGPGTYSLAILESHPDVRATLLDLELPISEARRIVEERGMSDRVDFVAADAFSWSTDRRFDAVLVSNTLHMLGPDLSRQLLGNCFGLLVKGGQLIVQAQYLNDDRISPRWPTLLNLIQRIATPTGRNHALGETRQWMEQAGFTDVVHVPMSSWNTNSALVGRRPA